MHRPPPALHRGLEKEGEEGRCACLRVDGQRGDVKLLEERAGRRGAEHAEDHSHQDRAERDVGQQVDARAAPRVAVLLAELAHVAAVQDAVVRQRQARHQRAHRHQNPEVRVAGALALWWLCEQKQRSEWQWQGKKKE